MRKNALRAIEAEWPRVVRREPCVYCGKPPKRKGRGSRTVTLEHIVPRSHGGTKAPDNIAGACEQCNGRRGNQPFMVFMVTARRFLDARRAYYTLIAAQRVGQAPKGASYAASRLQKEMDATP